MSSCKGVVKPGKTVSVRSFIPPVQTIELPQDPNAPLAQGTSKKNVSKRQEGLWVSSDQDQEAYNQASRIKESAREEAREIMMKANETAEAILKEAREEAEALKKGALEDGYKEGYENGRREGFDTVRKELEQEYQNVMDGFGKDMKQALGSVQEAKQECVKKYLEELKDCSIAVAEKVIHISLASSGEIIKRMILSETEQLKKTAWVKIYMEKTDYELMAQADADVIGELSRLSDNIKFIVMEKEKSGSCIIEVPDEIIDISVDTQLENMREILGSIRI